MNNPPASPSDAQVLAAVQSGWDLSIDAVEYFPAGFGAHHWVGLRVGETVLFITLDSPSDPDLLEKTYAAAGELNVTLPDVAIAPLPSKSGGYTVPLATGLLSATPWIPGVTPADRESMTEAQHLRVRQLLIDLHSSTAPPSLQVWRPAVDSNLADQLRILVQDPWTSGSQGEPAHLMILSELDSITRKANRFQELLSIAASRRDRWVPTHGEPHFANQIWIGDSVRLVDWESFRLAPPERDLREVPPSLRGNLSVEPEMLEMFELEWTLAEIVEYARWLSNPHEGNEDDLQALENLRIELERD